MRQVFNGEQIRMIYINSVAEKFSVEELDAINSFYGSPAGQSFITKAPVAMAKVMLLLQAQIERLGRDQPIQ